MMVAELIAQLQKLQPDAYVRLETYEGLGLPFKSVKVYGEGMVYLSCKGPKGEQS